MLCLNVKNKFVIFAATLPPNGVKRPVKREKWWQQGGSKMAYFGFFSFKRYSKPRFFHVFEGRNIGMQVSEVGNIGWF